MRSDKLKIGIVYGNLNVGGGAYQLLSLANILSKNNEVTVFVYRDLTKGNYSNLTSRIKIVEVDKNNNNNNSIINVLLEPFNVSFRLAKLIKNYELDILNPHEWPANWACSLVKINKKTPIVWMCNDVWHLPGFFTEKRIKFRIFKNTFVKIADLFFSLFLNRIVVLDNRIKRIVENYYHKSVAVVRSGIDVNKYKVVLDKKAARKKLNLDQKKFIFVCSSIFFPHRRFEDVIDAVKVLSKKQKNLQLLILGSSKFAPGYFESIKTKINRESLSKIAIINDAFLPNDLLKTYVVSSDVYIFPNEKQTWGLAAIEAMALGKACIVSDEAGVHEIVEDGENGLIFKCRDVEDLTKKMEKLIKDNKLRERIGKNARKFVLANFSWENYAKSMMDIFQEVAR